MMAYDLKSKPKGSTTPAVPQAKTSRAKSQTLASSQTSQSKSAPSNASRILVNPKAVKPGAQSPSPFALPKQTQGPSLEQLLFSYRQNLSGLTPEQQAQQVKLNSLTVGTTIPAVNQDVAQLLNQTTGLNTFLGKLGTANTANILSGTMRTLATLPGEKKNQLQNYTRNVIQSPAELAALGNYLKKAKADGQIDTLLKDFKALNGKDLYTVLGEKVTNPADRQALLKYLPPALSQGKLTQLAFLESLSSADVYSSDTGKAMTTSGKVEPKKGGTPTEVLKAFGYTADDNIASGWGMDFRVFRPKDPKQPIIIAMRGTEGVAFHVNQNGPGTIDSTYGDFGPKEPGINQFEPNRALLNSIVQQAQKSGQKIIWTGHSLGGALAQEGAATFPQATASVATFQSANIPKSYVDKVIAYNKAHPDAPIDTTHLRIDGDSVPTSGSAALPGNIYYMDYMSKATGQSGNMTKSPISELLPGIQNPLLKEAATTAGNKLPMLSTNSATTGHVIPSANMLLRQEYAQSSDPHTKALLKYGPKDPTTLNGDRQSAVAFAGQYKVQNDPRLNMEQPRQTVMPQLLNLTGTSVEAFRASAPLSNAQEYLVNAASRYHTFEEFQQYAHHLASQKTLPMTGQTQEMAREYMLDKSPRDNAKDAAQNLLGLNVWSAAQIGDTIGPRIANMAYNVARVTGENDIASAGFGLNTVLSIEPTAGSAGATYLYQKWMNQYADTPTLNTYEAGGNGMYETPVDNRVRDWLRDSFNLRTLWEIRNSQGSKK